MVGGGECIKVIGEKLIEKIIVSYPAVVCVVEVSKGILCTDSDWPAADVVVVVEFVKSCNGRRQSTVLVYF